MITERKAAIPDGVTVIVNGSTLEVSGPKGTLSKDLRYPGINIRVEDGEVVFSTESTRKKIYAMLGTYTAHAKNMCIGVTEGYTYTMKVVYSHFPIQLKVKDNGLEIVNFLGEKEARHARFMDGVDVKIAGDEVIVSGLDKECVGTTAGCIERATRVGHRDNRVFQDGIYIVEKA